jgi:glycerol-3-phosphate O-acyltransferase/dihydroxyacetone phosphate acyltransferase
LNSGSEPPPASRGQQPLGYRAVRFLARKLLELFYRRVEVVGLEHVPAEGPVILAPNHQNSMIDPALVVATMPRRLVPIAKAPLFRNPLTAPLLRLAGALPAHRRQDAGSDPAKNVEMLRAATATLRNGGAVLIFPEGLSQPEPVLMPLRTGAARMLLSAESEVGGTLGVTLLPVGLLFHEPGLFRTGRALVLVGPPVRTDDLIGLYGTAPEAAVRQLTQRLSEALRRQIVEASDRQTLRLLHVVASLLREESAGEGRDLASWAERNRRLMRAYRYLSSQDTARVEGLRIQVERYAGDLERAGVTGSQLARTYPAGVVWRYAIREGSAMLLGLPLALWGMVNHAIPYQLTKVVSRLMRPVADREATYKVFVGIVAYPLCWAVQSWLVWRLGGGWLLGIFIASLVPTGLFALTWRERVERFRREVRGFFHFLRNRDLRQRLIERRRAILDELTALSGAVPESVLAGQPSGGP